MKHNGQGVIFLTDPERFAAQTNLYLDVRNQEGRVLTDEQVARLPEFEPTDASLRREWRWRKRSLSRLFRYLSRHHSNNGLNILDLGCGNGWMSVHLAKLPGVKVWAADVNLPEMEQGVRVAAGAGLENIQFVFADILENNLPESHFNLVILAASVQYFPDMQALMLVLKRVLKPGGEIHFIDSPFYASEAKRQGARDATGRYYAHLGVPDMAQFYHHHLWAEIAALGGKNRNVSLLSFLLQKLRWWSPFPWVVVNGH